MPTNVGTNRIPSAGTAGKLTQKKLFRQAFRLGKPPPSQAPCQTLASSIRRGVRTSCLRTAWPCLREQANKLICATHANPTCLSSKSQSSKQRHCIASYPMKHVRGCLTGFFCGHDNERSDEENGSEWRWQEEIRRSGCC